MDTFEVLDGGGASQVEEVLADADVASASPLRAAMCARACSTAMRRRSTARPGAVCCSSTELLCRASSSAMDTVRPLPDAAWVQLARSGQAPQASGSNSTVSPGSNGSTSPAGQVIVLARRSILKSPLVNRPGRLRRPHGLAKTVPP